MQMCRGVACRTMPMAVGCSGECICFPMPKAWVDGICCSHFGQAPRGCEYPW
jgi:hypothetical protein